MRLTCRSFTSGNGPWYWYLPSKRKTFFFFSSETRTAPPGVMEAASSLSSGSVSPGLLPGMAKVCRFFGPMRTAREATTSRSPVAATLIVCRSSPARPGPIFPSGANGIALLALSDATHSVRAGVMTMERTSLSVSPAPTE